MSNLTKNHRHITQRWFITGTLELVTPTLLSNGDDDPSVDLPILTDPLTGCALLTGATLAGGLRNYLSEYRGGHKALCTDDRTQRLFGDSRTGASGADSETSRTPDEGVQSPLVVEDALGDAEKRPSIELRDGVRIDEETRTAASQAKYDLQLLAAGTTFDIGFELVINEEMMGHEEELLQDLAIILGGLQDGHIRLGMRKNRGFGACKVTDWHLARYDLQTADGLLGWLNHPKETKAKVGQQGKCIYDLLSIDQLALKQLDERENFTLSADFDINGSILIRSGFETDDGPDVTHLSTKRWNKDKKEYRSTPVLSGTSLGGVIRAQIGRIARTLDHSIGQQNAENLLNQMFGQMDENDKKATRAGRVRVDETAIKGGTQWVQQRVAIDRFTGGALESALFAEQPIFGGQTQLYIRISQPSEAEIGLVLLLLKDLWTGYTPVGGETSVGRGRLKGKRATITHGQRNWEISQADDGKISVAFISSAESDQPESEISDLNEYVQAIKAELEASA